MSANLAKRKNLSSADVKQRERLAYLEALMVWRGRISRTDLTTKYAVSLSQAAEDFSALRQMHKSGIVRGSYKGIQCVIATESFSPVINDPGALGGAAVLVGGEWVSAAKSPPRRGGPAIETPIARAVVNGLEVEILYHSVNSGTSSWRKVSPVRFVNDGSRWHVRAAEGAKFKDFVLGRIEKVRLGGPALTTAKQDKDWAKFVAIVIRPRRGLNTAQTRALVFDHGMRNGRMTIRVRKPLAFYVLNSHGLLPGTNSSQLELVSPRLGSSEYAEIIGREM